MEQLAPEPLVSSMVKLTCGLVSYTKQRTLSGGATGDLPVAFSTTVSQSYFELILDSIFNNQLLLPSNPNEGINWGFENILGLYKYPIISNFQRDFFCFWRRKKRIQKIKSKIKWAREPSRRSSHQQDTSFFHFPIQDLWFSIATLKEKIFTLNQSKA